MVIAILLLGAGVAEAAPVTGRVVDTTGKPVRGATITVEGRERGVTTAADGSFAIADAPEGASLVILKDGFGAGLAIAGQSDDIVLLPEDKVAETIEITGEVGTTRRAPRSSRASKCSVARHRNDIVRSLQAMQASRVTVPLGKSAS